MRSFFKTLFYSSLLVSLVSCESYLGPREDNRLTEEEMVNSPVLFEGILLNVYNALPSIYEFNEAVLSDDAVTNNKTSNYRRVATGEWTSIFYPNSKWSQAYEAIYHLNYFLSKYQEVEWSYRDAQENQWHLERLKGEAHGLRAYWQFILLQHHAGESPSGELLGFPIITEVQEIKNDFQLPRNTYAECMNHILADIDTAMNYLPYEYENIPTSEPNSAAHNFAFGRRFRNRIDGRSVEALKTRFMLHASSPAFAHLTWEESAIAAGSFLEKNEGINALTPSGNQFYLTFMERDVIWRTTRFQSNEMERENFPPSEYGMGRINPTQDLVNAFPMQNGYPINHESSDYAPDDPYSNRDPRLSYYIIYNGNQLKDSIFTHTGDASDGINRLETSTRSGYYLKKLMSTSVNLEPGNITVGDHFYTYVRYTEIFLNYAEAANEAWGPDGDPQGYGLTARSVIAAIRARAGINQPDVYLQSISDKESMRELIQQERRIELCFEGFRFWDLRRWNLVDQISEDVHAMRIDFSQTPSYVTEFLEERGYKDYMIYGPIPYEETLKYDIVQNAGW